MRKTEKRKKDNSPMRKGAYYYGAILIALNVLVVSLIMSGCTKDVIDMSSPTEDLKAAGIEETFPPISAESVEVNPVIGVTFLPGTDPSKITSAKLTLKNGNTTVQGKMAISGNTALFTYADDLIPNSEYTATLKTGGNKGSADDGPGEYTWNFKTGTEHQDNSLSVVSVNPANKAKDIPVSTSLTITVNKEIRSWMKAFTTVVLKAGSTSIAGSLSFSGKVITFDPSLNLTSNTLYAGEFIFKTRSGNNDGDDDDDDDHDGDHGDDDKSGSVFSWSFTTLGGVITGGDITPPSVSSVNPANNAASVATNSKVTATFNEPMSSASITSSTFSLKQGTTVVAGTVTCSGNIATFAPGAALAEGRSYTATVTHGSKGCCRECPGCHLYLEFHNSRCNSD